MGGFGGGGVIWKSGKIKIKVHVYTFKGKGLLLLVNIVFKREK